MKFSAQHIRYFSLVTLLLWIVCFAAGSPRAEGLKAFATPLKGEHKELEKVVESFQEASEDIDYSPFQRAEKDLKEVYEKYYGSLDDLNNAPPSEKPQVKCEKRTEVDYYFSFSMPSASISYAVSDALALRKDCVDVRMRLRGLVDNNLKKTILAFVELARDNPEDLPVEIDPEGFINNNIREVPTIIVNGKKFVGDMRLTGIIRNLETMKEGAIAAAYDIKEENIIDMLKRQEPILEQKIKEYIASGAVERKFRLSRYDGKYGRAEEERSYYIDPTYTLPENIYDHEGNLVMQAGTKVNPLDITSIGKYIFIDGNNPEEVNLALESDYRQIILVSGDALELAKKYKIQFYHVNDELIRFFRIQRVPLIIQQEGRLIRATERPI